MVLVNKNEKNKTEPHNKTLFTTQKKNTNTQIGRQLKVKREKSVDKMPFSQIYQAAKVETISNM